MPIILEPATTYQIEMSQPGPPGSGVGALLKNYTVLGQLPDWIGDVTVDLADGNMVQPNITGDVTSIAITGWPAAGIEAKVAFYVPAGNTPYNIAGWPAEVVWVGGVPPSFSIFEGDVDVVVLSSVDGGATILGFYLGRAS